MATTKNKILDYVMESPYNSNRAVLDGLLNDLISGGDVSLDDFIAGRMPTVTSKLTAVPDFAFSGKKALTTVNLPEATYIGQYAFSAAPTSQSGSGSGSSEGEDEGSEGEDETLVWNNKNLVTVNMPKVTQIDSYAFQGDENLVISEFPESLTIIKDSAFNDCPKVQVTRFPNGITYIGDNEALPIQENLDLDSVPDSLVYLGSGISEEQFYNYFSQYLVDDVLDLSLVPIKWFEIQTATYRFGGLPLGESITIPSGVTSLEGHMFPLGGYIANVSSINLPEGLVSIGDNVFGNCNALTELTLPDSLTSIGDNAFNGCQSLTSIDLTQFNPTNIPQIGSSVFYAPSPQYTFYFSDQETLEAFASASNWADYADYFAVASSAE